MLTSASGELPRFPDVGKREPLATEISERHQRQARKRGRRLAGEHRALHAPRFGDPIADDGAPHATPGASLRPPDARLWPTHIPDEERTGSYRLIAGPRQVVVSAWLEGAGFEPSAPGAEGPPDLSHDVHPDRRLSRTHASHLDSGGGIGPGEGSPITPEFRPRGIRAGSHDSRAISTPSWGGTPAQARTPMDSTRWSRASSTK